MPHLQQAAPSRPAASAMQAGRGQTEGHAQRVHLGRTRTMWGTPRVRRARLMQPQLPRVTRRPTARAIQGITLRPQGAYAGSVLREAFAREVQRSIPVLKTPARMPAARRPQIASAILAIRDQMVVCAICAMSALTRLFLGVRFALTVMTIQRPLVAASRRQIVSATLVIRGQMVASAANALKANTRM